MLRFPAVLMMLTLCAPAAAMVGGATPAPKFSNAVVMLAGPQGFCSGAAIARHPQFDAEAVRRHRVTADVALLKFSESISSAPVPLGPAGLTVAAGDPLLVAGYGLATPGDGRSGGTVRIATLIATGQPGTLQIRLMDPATQNKRPGLGACTGDSGAPVFVNSAGALAVIGVVSTATGANNTAGCGGLTIVTPLVRYRSWILEQMKRMGGGAQE